MAEREAEVLPLFVRWPRLAAQVPVVSLGRWPTPVEALRGVDSDGEPLPEGLWVKRDDLSSPVYGGNKVRTLELLFGDALSRGSRAIYSTGAFGSNHAVATARHAPRVGLEPGAILFPQPRSGCGRENLEVTIGAVARARLHALAHWSQLPAGIVSCRLAARRRAERVTVMAPGGATPLGALGYVSAALELAAQVSRGELPAPATIVLGVGSTCTSAGLLVGLRLAARARLGFRSGRAPRLVAVRVTPWPVTSAHRIAQLARATSELLAELTGDASLSLSLRELRSGLEVDGRFLGWGYGRPTRTGRAAMAVFSASSVGLPLDTTYTAKSAAGFLRRAGRLESRPVVYWSTRSTAPLPSPDAEKLAAAPWLMRRWLALRAG